MRVLIRAMPSPSAEPVAGGGTHVPEESGSIGEPDSGVGGAGSHARTNPVPRAQKAACPVMRSGLLALALTGQAAER